MICPSRRLDSVTMISFAILLVWFPAAHCIDFDVAIVPLSPLNTCPEGSSIRYSQLVNQSTRSLLAFKGFDFDLLGSTLFKSSLNITDIIFHCTNYTDSLHEIDIADVDLAAGSFIVSDELIRNYEISTPTFTSSIYMAVKYAPNENIWSFFHVFSFQVWIIILVTAIVVGFCAWLMETRHYGFVKSDYTAYNLGEMIWHSFSALFFNCTLQPNRLQTKILYLGFWFLIVLLAATYQADLTAKLSSKNVNIPFTSILSAKGYSNLVVYAYDTYDENYINPYEWRGKVKYFPRNNKGTEALVSEFLKDEPGSAQAVILEKPLIDMISQKYPCFVQVLSSPLQDISYSFLIPKKKAATKTTIDTELINAMENNLNSQLYKKHTTTIPVCQKNSIEATTRLTSLGGLFVFILIVSVFALIMEGVLYVCGKYKNRKKKKEAKQSVYSAELPVLMTKTVLDMGKDQSKIMQRNAKLNNYLTSFDYLHLPNPEVPKAIENDFIVLTQNLERMIKNKFREIEKKILFSIGKNAHNFDKYQIPKSEVIAEPNRELEKFFKDLNVNEIERKQEF